MKPIVTPPPHPPRPKRPAETQQDIESAVMDLLNRARAAGFVVTVQTWPKTPLAMGNYDMVFSVRPARERAK